MIIAPETRIWRPNEKPSFIYTQAYGLDRRHFLGPAGGLVGFWLLNEGSGEKVFDLSGFGNHGAISGLTWQPGKFGPALNGDGGGNYVDCGDMTQIEGASAFSISLWAKVPGNEIAATEMLLGKQGEGGDRTFYLSANDSEDVHFGVYNSDATLATAIYVDGLFNKANIWIHIAGVYDGANVRVYVNGVVGGTAPALTGVTDSSIANMALMADNVFGQNDWIGTGDNVKIWNRALSVSEILQDMREPFCMIQKIPFIIGGKTLVVAGNPMLLEGSLISSPLLNGRLIA